MSSSMTDKCSHQPISASGWRHAIAQIESVYRTSTARTVSSRARSTSTKLIRGTDGAAPPRWRIVPKRVRAAVADLGPEAAWLPDLVALGCAHLDPTGNIPRDRVLRDLRALAEVAPLATRSSLVLAAAALRMLEDAGEMAVLLQ